MSLLQFNLLPWREYKKQQEARFFIVAVLFTSVFIMASVFCFNRYIVWCNRMQANKNTILQQEIVLFNKQLKEQKKLVKKAAKLIKKISWHHRRLHTQVAMRYLLTELSKITPTTIYLTKLEKKHKAILLEGISTSSKDVSQLMRRIEQNKWFQQPLMHEIKQYDSRHKFKISLFLAVS